MSFNRAFDHHGGEKATVNDYMPSTGSAHMGIVNVAFEDDVMSVQLAPTATVKALKALVYEQTFLPPSMQSLYACIGGTPAEVPDYEQIGMVPTSKPLALVMAGESPTC
ncbi:hypothetical protein KFE25_003622 [Diacronema lutheri]|uniref:Ubiquitin-like domain-containing protein n=1 Tax=Diacronema lutheri TaxID=2081491 RepID=A0A8J5XCD5_DIALT|nr:hypothetical protein KFE25_003622 [Diacronema lutheri]